MTEFNSAEYQARELKAAALADVLLKADPDMTPEQLMTLADHAVPELITATATMARVNKPSPEAWRRAIEIAVVRRVKMHVYRNQLREFFADGLARQNGPTVCASCNLPIEDGEHVTRAGDQHALCHLRDEVKHELAMGHGVVNPRSGRLIEALAIVTGRPFDDVFAEMRAAVWA